MKISLQWLQEYVDYQDSPQHLEQMLTNLGFEVDSSEQVDDDWVLDLEITSNRPDCLGHIGIAREIAAATNTALKMPPADFAEEGPAVTERTKVSNESPRFCSRYTARIIDGVTIGPSPDWMQRRLKAVGLRPINNVVDISNYVLMEIGQPLHCFDHDRLAEGRIVVRQGRPGEQMVTIDHVKQELSEDMLVIADADKAVALAGIMGGADSEVSDSTKTVLLESAHFDPLSVRRTARALTLISESSFRFERNVDAEMVEWASRRATRLLVELAGGKAAPGVLDSGPYRPQSQQVTMRLARLETLLGIKLEGQYVLGILQRLGFAPKLHKSNIITCTAPSWRGDVTREVDLIEEIIRVHGYAHIPTEQKIHIQVTTPDQYQRTVRKVTTALNGCGFFETVNVGFVEDEHWPLFAADGFEPVRVQDMTRRSNNALRPSLLPALMAARKRNQDAGNEQCDFYELAAVHHPGKPGSLPQETIMLALLTDGDFRQLRGVIEAVVAALDRQSELRCEPTSLLWAANDTGAELRLGEKVIGHIGCSHDKLVAAFDLKHQLCLAEITFADLIDLEGKSTLLEPIPRFPAINRDLSLVLDESVAWAQIEQLICQQNIADLRQVSFVDTYRGKGLKPSQKSLTLSMEFRRPAETLTHEQVDQYQNQILQAFKQTFAAELRA